jgi:Na+-translocating ferredoxin:NAD+ oxidoreductase RnfC subunit
MSGNMNGMMQMPMPNPTQDLENTVRSVNERRSNDAESRARFEQRSALLRQQAAARREEARAQAAAVASATSPGSLTAADIRDALEQDLKAWRSEFDVGRREWQAMRGKWLVAEASLSASGWAAHRLDWFAAREAWIAERGLGG